MERKLNILMMVSWYGPKAERLVGGSFHYELAKGLNSYCNCAIYYPYDRTIDEINTSGFEWGIMTYRSKYKLENKIRNRLYMYKTMKKIIKEFHPDLIHANVATEVGRFAIVLGKIFGLPVIITEHSAVEASGVKSFPHKQYARFAYSNSRYNACVSDKLAENLKCIFPDMEFHTVYNCVKNIEEVNYNGGEVYRDANAVNIAVVAAFYDKNIKGFQYILPVMKRIIEEGDAVKLHIVGGGEYLEFYKQKAEELGIDAECVFYGRCSKEKVYQIIYQMDFMLSASLFESFGCSIAEGQMLGKPAVVTRCGGLESIVDNDTGILVEKGSEEELYKGIRKMLAEYKNFCPEKLMNIANKKYSVDSICMKYMEIYRNILNGGEQNSERR